MPKRGTWKGKVACHHDDCGYPIDVVVHWSWWPQTREEPEEYDVDLTCPETCPTCNAELDYDTMLQRAENAYNDDRTSHDLEDDYYGPDTVEEYNGER